MKKFDARITEIEEGLLKDVGKGFLKDIGKGIKNTVMNPVKNVAKTGLSIGKGLGNTAIGAATLNPDRIKKGLDQSVGTTLRGAAGTVGDTISNVAELPKNISQGNLAGAVGNITGATAAVNPVAAAKKFARHAATQTPSARAAKNRALASGKHSTNTKNTALGS